MFRFKKLLTKALVQPGDTKGEQMNSKLKVYEYIYLSNDEIERLLNQTRNETVVDRGQKTTEAESVKAGAGVGLGIRGSYDSEKSIENCEEARIIQTIEQKLVALRLLLKGDLQTTLRGAIAVAKKSSEPVYLDIRERFYLPQFSPHYNECWSFEILPTVGAYLS